MHNEVTYNMHLKSMLVLEYVLEDFRSECLEWTKFTHGCQNQIFSDQKKSFRDRMHC